ncbi:coiled-coil domain-containing protein 107 isoform X2 [Manis pentadactyla]|uniref:coiled-coil domain-containing protein 107 isoform X2 n=1 Tax=Manis pentadactyla TaxID=143292 RepID=UPI001873AF5C|nr:coiled-coil domain-containing protein 107 isoform X2 [Manis pentadactyla]
MASSPTLAGVLGLLLASTLPGVLGDGPNPDLRAHSGTRKGCWREAGTARGSQAPAFPPLLSSGDPAQIAPGAVEPRRRAPPKDQRERAGAPALPLGALYTAAVVAFVLYKCLQGKDESAVLKETGKKESLQSEQQLALLTKQLAQTEQHLNNLVAQLDPLFERVTTLAGAQQELLNMKLQTIHQLLQESKPNKSVEVQEPGKGSGGESLLEAETVSGTGACQNFPLTEANIPFPKDLCLEEEEEEEADDSQTWEEPLNWSTETRNLATPCEVEQGLRRRCSKAAAKGPSHSPHWEGGTTTAEVLVK